MRFIIYGAGAIGSVVGAYLARAGANVALVARPEQVRAITDDGLLIKSPEGDFIVRGIVAVDDVHQLAARPGDVLLLTVKSQHSQHAVHNLHQIFPEETPIFCLQNGVRNEEEAAHRFLHVYGVMVDLSATPLAPGQVVRTRSTLLSLGNYPRGCDDTCRQVAKQLADAGLEARLHESVMAVKWTKLVLNLNNATLAITGKSMQEAWATPTVASFMAEVLEEGLHVLETAHIPLTDPDNPYQLAEQIAALRAVPDDAARLQEAQNMSAELRTYPSTLVDLQRQRGETEAGYLNGEIILLGEKHHVPTPYNSTLLSIVETMAAEGTAPGRYTIAELGELVEQERHKFYGS